MKRFHRPNLSLFLKWSAIILLAFLIRQLAFDEERIFTSPPASSAQAYEPSKAQLRLLLALENERDLLLAFRDKYGHYPQITRDTDWRRDLSSIDIKPGQEGDTIGKADFTGLANGEKLVISVVSDFHTAKRFVGVKSGEYLNDPDFRKGLVDLSRGNGKINLYNFDGTPYSASDPLAFIPLDDAALAEGDEAGGNR